MSRSVESLSRGLERLAPTGDPSGVFERLERRRNRRRFARKAGLAGLAVGVVVGAAATFVVLNRLFVVGGGDEENKIGSAPVAAARNGRIAFTSADSAGNQITLITPTGEDPVTIPAPGEGFPWHLSWSPDGKRLAVAVFPTGSGPRRLYIMDADGSEPLEVAAFDNVSRASWSPDGAKIAYAAESAGRSEIHLVNADGTGRVVVGRGDGGLDYFSASWSPDGESLLFDLGTDSGFDIFVMDADGTNVRRLTNSGTDYNPSWSPDGTRIAFTRQEGPMWSNVFVMDADGSNVQRLTDDGDGHTNLDPIWSPDGSQIAYEAAIHGGTGPLIVMDEDGSDPRTIVSADILGLAWQPLPGGAQLPDPSPVTEPPEEPGEDIGLGFRVCDVSRVTGDFLGNGSRRTAWVATKLSDGGRCPGADRGLVVLAADLNGDALVDVSYRPIECEGGCWALTAPDLDGDGRDEVLVGLQLSSTPSVGAYAVSGVGGNARLSPVEVAEPGDPAGGFEAGQAVTFVLGGDAGNAYALRCQDGPRGRVLVASAGHHEVEVDDTWDVHETTLQFRDGRLNVLGVREYQAPVGFEPPFPSPNRVCGAPAGV